MVEEKVSIVDEEEHSQRQPKESRAGRESTALNMASRLCWAMREERGVEGAREEGKRKEEEKAKREGPKEPRLYRIEKPGEGKPVMFRGGAG